MSRPAVVCLPTQQIFGIDGGYGYFEEYEIEKLMRDAPLPVDRAGRQRDPHEDHQPPASCRLPDLRSWAMTTESRTESRTTFCRVCESLCGMVADLEDGRLVRLRPDKEHPMSAGLYARRASPSPRWSTIPTGSPRRCAASRTARSPKSLETRRSAISPSASAPFTASTAPGPSGGTSATRASSATPTCCR